MKDATYIQNTLSGQPIRYIDNPEYAFIKASKRGNDVYKYLIKQKFKKLETIENIEYFRDDYSRKKTKLLFITLTFDIKKSTPIESWYLIPILFNKFKSNLTKQYGNIKTFRVWESTQKYYAHIHALFYFQDTEFEVFSHINNKNKTTYRIPYYQSNKIKQYYPFNIDIQACDTFNRAINEITKYIGKYLTKETKQDKPTKTNAMIWLTGKQGYSISKDFFETIINQTIDIEEPKSADLTYYMCNSNPELYKWRYIGLISRKELKITSKKWFLRLKKPPPNVMNIINQLIQDNLTK